MDLPNRAALFAVGRRYVRTTPNTRVNPNLVDVAGSDVNLLVGSASLMGEAAVAAFAACLRGLFAETARGDQLDRLAGDRTGLTRKPESFATVDLLLTRPTALAGGGTVSAGFRVQTPDGTAFSLDVDVVFGALDLQQPARATALVAGPGSNVPAGAITSFLDAPFDGTIVPSNAGPAAGGSDEETDAQFRGRYIGFFKALRRGTLGAIEFGALQVPGVAVATAIEVVNPGNALPAGAVTLVVGDQDGNATDSMLTAVRDELVQWRAAGIPVFVFGGLVVREPVIWRGLAYQTGVDTVQAQDDVRSVTVAITQFIKAGDPLRRSDLFAAARTVPGVIIPDSALAAPVGDVFPTDVFHIIRVEPDDVSFVPA